ncbi:hypothetical protein B0H14DRAFT_2632469 [Mycena olivaceomarginata]|nr:hypothetical protein B0H14DRAFT_2632469 [Mycena olivaceomarginata]
MTRQRRNPPAKRRNRTRTRAQERELARIRRLDPADQICALLAIKDDLRYLREGPGSSTRSAGGAGQTQMWFVAFEVQRRLLAARYTAGADWTRIWAGPIRGAVLVRHQPPRISLDAPGGSLEEIETIARESLAIIGEPTVIRKTFVPEGGCARYSAGLLRFRRR